MNCVKNVAAGMKITGFQFMLAPFLRGRSVKICNIRSFRRSLKIPSTRFCCAQALTEVSERCLLFEITAPKFFFPNWHHRMADTALTSSERTPLIFMHH